MDLLKDRRTVLLGGGAVALVAGMGIAWSLVAGHRGETQPPPPASSAGLVIDPGGADDVRLDATKPLRCFVAGQFVGQLTLAECAKRNGVSTDALDVGLDQTGALAAADQAGAVLTPLPPQSKAGEGGDAAASSAAAMVASGVLGVCQRYADAQWRRLPAEMSLAACAQTLFSGHCVRPGGETYGRWAQQTLRLAPGRIEISADNHNFHPLIDLPGCSGAPLG